MGRRPAVQIVSVSITGIMLMSILLSVALSVTLQHSSAENVVSPSSSNIFLKSNYSSVVTPERAVDQNHGITGEARFEAEACQSAGTCTALTYFTVEYTLQFISEQVEWANISIIQKSFHDDEWPDQDPVGLLYTITVDSHNGRYEVLNKTTTPGSSQSEWETIQSNNHRVRSNGTIAVTFHMQHEDDNSVTDSAHWVIQEIEAEQAIVDSDGDGVLDTEDACEGFDDSVDADSDGIPDGCDDLIDGDDDGISDDIDSCPEDYFDWFSTNVTDYDSDGCQDENEDADDDNDGVGDLQDNCQFSEYGWDEKFPLIGEMKSSDDVDGDGCHDTWEDLDLDGDGVDDWDRGGSDSCIYPTGVTGWISTPENDHDGDGCRDADEDEDDDNDYVADEEDSCPTGIVGWLDSYTDHDGDGCRDDVEDDDDDNDTIPDNVDSCPKGVRYWTPTLDNDMDSDGCADLYEDDDDDGDGIIDAWTPSWGCTHGTECELNFTKNGQEFFHVFVLQCRNPVTGQWCDETENSSRIKQFSITVNGISRIVNISVSNSTTTRVVLDVYENDEVVQSITLTHDEPIGCIDVKTGRFVVVSQSGGYYSGCSGNVVMQVIEETIGGHNVSFYSWGKDAPETFDGPWWLALTILIIVIAVIFVISTVAAAGAGLFFDSITRKMRKLFGIGGGDETDDNANSELVAEGSEVPLDEPTTPPDSRASTNKLLSNTVSKNYPPSGFSRLVEHFNRGGGAGTTNAGLRYADLTDADLRYADLTNADLYSTDLTDAYLYYPDLTNADLRYADLSEAVKIAEEALLIADRLTYAGEKFDSAEEIRLGDAANLAGHTSRAEGYYSQALHNSKLRKNKQIQAEALNKLGTIRKNRRHPGELKKAEDFYSESYAIYCEISDREGQGNLLNNLALIAKVRGHFNEAEDLFQKCLENRLEIEDRLGESKTLHNLGNIRRVRRDFNGAQRFYNRSLKIKYDINDKIGEGTTLHSLGLLSHDKKDYKKAKLFLEQSLKIRVEVGDSRGKAGVLNSLGNLALTTGDFKTAALLCKESLSIYKAHDNRNGWSMVLDSLGDIAMANEAFKEADKFYNDSLRISQGDGKGEMPINEAATLHNLGTNAIKLDNPEMAEKYFRSHVQIKNGLDLPLDEWYVEHGYTDPDAEWDFPPPETSD